MKSTHTTRFARVFAALIFVLFAARAMAPAQVIFTESHAQIDQLSVGDIDFKSVGSNHWFFTLTIGGAPSAQLILTLSAALGNGQVFSPAATLVTDPFDASQVMSISNLDLGPAHKIHTQSFSFDGTAETVLKNAALSTGKLPAGTYTFNCRLVNSSTQADLATPLVIVLNIQNYSRVDLIQPPNQSNIANAFPLFQWIYDGPDVDVSVYEKLASMSSDEEAANGTPFLDVKTGTSGFPSGSHTFQYPSTGVRPLQVGHTYVWKVEGLTTGAGGAGSPINSEIWEFTLTNGSGDNGNGNGQNLTNALLNMGFSQDMINSLLNGNLTPTGVIYLNGQAISMADVQAILAMLTANPDKVISVTWLQ